jgi:hypothetical protein
VSRNSRFAADTDVPVERSRAELDALLGRHGATQRANYVDEDAGRAAVQFRLSGRMVRLEVNHPRPGEIEVPPAGRRGNLSAEQWLKSELAQRERTAWRRLLLVVKAKLELVADGGSTFEREFLADILLPDGQTVYQSLQAPLEDSYRTGGMPKLLGGMS